MKVISLCLLVVASASFLLTTVNVSHPVARELFQQYLNNTQLKCDRLKVDKNKV